MLEKIFNLAETIKMKLPGKGMYEVLDYESTLEILDEQGKKARFSKQKKVKYLQDNVIAYPDFAWGDGEILLNYKTNKGRPVDRYRTGYKTYILLSLREVKNQGDVDEFQIQWDIINGFLTEDGYWATDVSYKTGRIKVNVIFPKSRQPYGLSMEEEHKTALKAYPVKSPVRLPDGRWQVSWGMSNPKQGSMYILRWMW